MRPSAHLVPSYLSPRSIALLLHNRTEERTMADTAHVDTFARDNLPPQDQWPAFVFNRPELQYPERLNCAAAFLDRWVEAGRGSEPCLLSPAETLSYC